MGVEFQKIKSQTKNSAKISMVKIQWKRLISVTQYDKCSKLFGVTVQPLLF